MKRLFALAVMLCFVGLTSAQSVPEKTENPTLPATGDVQSKRQEIEAARQRETARFDAADAQCQSRFAVNDCLRTSQSARRAVMAALRRQEVALNDAERARRGAEQVQRTKDKALARQQQAQEVAASHAANVAVQAQKRNEQAQKREANRSVAANPAGHAPKVPKAPSGPSPAEQAANRAEYERRQSEAQQRRTELQKRQQDKAGKPASSLPVPP